MKQQSQHKSLKDRLNLSIDLVDLLQGIMPARHSEQTLYYDDYCPLCMGQEGHLSCQGHESLEDATPPYAVQRMEETEMPEPAAQRYYITPYCAMCQEAGSWSCRGHMEGEWCDD